MRGSGFSIAVLNCEDCIACVTDQQIRRVDEGMVTELGPPIFAGGTLRETAASALE